MTEKTLQKKETKNLVQARCAFQEEVSAITKDGYNPFTKSAYAKLDDIFQNLNEELGKYGMNAFSKTYVSEILNCDVTKTTLVHIQTGEAEFSERISGTAGQKMQDKAGNETMAIRYNLRSLLHLQFIEEDKDGSEKPDNKPKNPSSLAHVSSITNGVPKKPVGIKYKTRDEIVKDISSIKTLTDLEEYTKNDHKLDINNLKTLNESDYNIVIKTLGARKSVLQTQEDLNDDIPF